MLVQADKVILQSDLAAAEQRCIEAEKESQASLENEHATSEEVQLLRRQLLESRYHKHPVPLATCNAALQRLQRKLNKTAKSSHCVIDAPDLTITITTVTRPNPHMVVHFCKIPCETFP